MENLVRVRVADAAEEMRIGQRALDRVVLTGQRVAELLARRVERFAALLQGRSGQLKGALTDQTLIAGIGNAYSDEILHAARLSPFKRGDDLSEREAKALREAMISELGRVLDVYEEKIALPLPEKYPKPTRVHAHQGEPCPRCETVLEAVFYEDYVMTYCPAEQTGGRVLKDRRLSRLLK